MPQNSMYVFKLKNSQKTARTCKSEELFQRLKISTNVKFIKLLKKTYVDQIWLSLQILLAQLYVHSYNTHRALMLDLVCFFMMLGIEFANVGVSEIDLP